MTELRPDVDAAKNAMEGKLTRSYGRSLEAIGKNLEPDERVLRIASGVRGNTYANNERGLMVLTDHKVLFVHEGIVRSSQESIPLDLVTGVAVHKGLRWSDIKTTGAQSNEVVKQVNKVDAEAMASELNTLLTTRKGRASQVTEVPPTSFSLADELTKLGALRDQGLLNEAEFTAQKAKLLRESA